MYEKYANQGFNQLIVLPAYMDTDNHEDLALWIIHQMFRIVFCRNFPCKVSGFYYIGKKNIQSML